jgi:hypothetical protein
VQDLVSCSVTSSPLQFSHIVAGDHRLLVASRASTQHGHDDAEQGTVPVEANSTRYGPPELAALARPEELPQAPLKRQD